MPWKTYETTVAPVVARDAFEFARGDLPADERGQRARHPPDRRAQAR